MESVSNTKVLIRRGPERAGVSPGPVVLAVPPLLCLNRKGGQRPSFWLRSNAFDET